MEQRDQQSMNLFKSTGSTSKSTKDQQMKAQMPNWKNRISVRALDRNCQFSNLMKHVNTTTLHEAYRALDGSKATGVDKVTKSLYGKSLNTNLEELAMRVQNGTYRPQPKREVLIPKTDGKFRPLAIASFEDKLVDWVVGKILILSYEPLFINDSYGYRPNKSAEGAIRACFQAIERNERPGVVEIDFTSFFNTINHKLLMNILEKRIIDKRFLGLIRRILSGEIIKETGEILPGIIGTPQGGIASPVLANIFLNEVLDHWFLQNYGVKGNKMVRYADDAVFFFTSEEISQQFLIDLKLRVEEYKLILNMNKSHILNFDKKGHEHFSFLGFTIYWGRQGSRIILKVKTKKEKLIKGIQEFYMWIKENRNKLKLKEIWKLAKAKIKGHANYYGFWMNATKVKHYYDEAVKALFKWLNRRSQKKSYTWESFANRLKALPLLEEWSKIKWKALGWSFGNV